MPNVQNCRSSRHRFTSGVWLFAGAFVAALLTLVTPPFPNSVPVPTHLAQHFRVRNIFESLPPFTFFWTHQNGIALVQKCLRIAITTIEFNISVSGLRAIDAEPLFYSC